VNAGKTGPYYWLATEYVEGKTQPARVLADIDELLKSTSTDLSGAPDRPATGRTDTVVEPARKSRATETVTELPAPAKPTDTVMEAAPKAHVRTETVVDEAPKRKP